MSGAVMPKQAPGKSKQDYETPSELLRAVERRFGRLHVDLAARPDNAKAPRFVTPERDSLKVDWSAEFWGSRCWLNPEFADIAPWAAKCSTSRGLHIFLLTPASIGANWFAEHVHGKAVVLGLSPRLTFVGASDPYPKDCMLSIFGFGVAGFDVWRWAP
jgi:phage N-6-adenine-methyltransferase